MMPSANTVAREKPPPANRSYRLNSVPCPWFRRKSASACTFTPGVAMWAPARYTNRHKNVMENFSQRSSGSLKTFSQAGNRNAMGDSGLDGAARLLDLRARGGGDGDALHEELPAHVTHAEQLDRVVGPPHEACAEEGLGSDLHPVGELRQVSHVHDLGRLLERVREPPLGDAADQRHLSAFEPRAGLTAAASRLTLAPAAGRLADPGARPAALADPGAVRARRGLEGLQRDPSHCRRGSLRLGPPRCFRFPLRLPRRLRHRSLPGLRRRYLDEVAHPVEHAAQCRVIRLDDHILVVSQPQRLECPPLHRGPADPGAPLPDPQLGLSGRRQEAVATRLALAVFPGGRMPTHGWPPDAACTESTRVRCRARGPPAAASSEAAARPASPAPCCADWSSPGSWSRCPARRRTRAPPALVLPR